MRVYIAIGEEKIELIREPLLSLPNNTDIIKIYNRKFKVISKEWNITCEWHYSVILNVEEI